MKIKSIERVQVETRKALFDGEYVGTWSGCVVELPLQTETWRINVDFPVRGRVPVEIKVRSGQIEITPVSASDDTEVESQEACVL